MFEMTEDEKEDAVKLLVLYTLTEEKSLIAFAFQVYPSGYDNGEVRIDIYRTRERATTHISFGNKEYERQGIMIDEEDVLTMMIENNEYLIAGGIWKLKWNGEQFDWRCFCSESVDFVHVPFLLTRTEYALVKEAVTYGERFLKQNVDDSPYFLNIREQGPLAPERRTILSQTLHSDPHTWISLWNLQTQRQYCFLNIMSLGENNQRHFSSEIIETGTWDDEEDEDNKV